MRILQLLFSRGFRGAERHVADLVNAQSRRHRVRLLLRADEAEDGISIRSHLDPSVDVRTLPPMALGPATWLAVRRFRPDVVHSHGGRAGRIAGRWSGGVPRLATMHLDYRANWYRRQQALVAPTDWQAEDARAKGFHGPVHRLDLWFTPHPAPTADRLTALRADLGAGPDELLVGAVGAFIPVKGMDTLIQAFRALPDPRLRLALVGHGPDRPVLEGLAAGDSRIRFTGFRRDVRDLYHAFDLFVFPSRDEPFGLVALEALDAGLPVLGTATHGARAILGPEAALVPPGDAGALARALEVAVAGPPARHRPDLSRWSVAHHLDGLDRIYGGLAVRR